MLVHPKKCSPCCLQSTDATLTVSFKDLRHHRLGTFDAVGFNIARRVLLLTRNDPIKDVEDSQIRTGVPDRFPHRMPHRRVAPRRQYNCVNPKSLNPKPWNLKPEIFIPAVELNHVSLVNVAGLRPVQVSVQKSPPCGAHALAECR